jgi:hypothetical protein
MEIKIDLHDIFQSEDGDAETLAESIKRQVTDQLIKRYASGITQQIEEHISETISGMIRDAVKDKMPALITEIMDAEYMQVDRYGSRKGPTSFRAEMIRTIHEEMQYKPDSNSYHKNAYTKTVETLVADMLKTFQTDFNKKVESTFTAAAMEHASHALKKKLGITV